jgi:hypothetical protein
MHHDERTFTFEGMVKFLGLEDADEYLTQTEDIRNGYLSALERYNEQFEELCRRNRIERVEVDTSHNMGDVLIDYLNQRSMLNRGR